MIREETIHVSGIRCERCVLRLAKTLEGVWSGQTSIDDAMTQIQTQWQADLNEG